VAALTFGRVSRKIDRDSLEGAIEEGLKKRDRLKASHGDRRKADR
jgi:hypothetical protein